MKQKGFSLYLSFALCAVLLSVTRQSIAEQKTVEVRLSEVELKEIFDNPMRSYVYIGTEVTDIAAIMEELSAFDNNKSSLVHGLVTHVKNGFNIGNYDAVAQALEEAEQLLIQNADALGEEKTLALSQSLNNVIEQVIEEKLNLDAETLSFLADSIPQDDALKSSCCKPKPHCHGLRLLVVKEKVDFLGKVKFKNDVTFKDDVTFQDEVVFEDPATFEDGVTIDGALSVTDLVVLSCIDNLCVNTLSVTDLIISGGSCFDNLCATNLSVTDLIVTNCVGNLCVTNLSVVDGSVGGTLSVSDLVAGSINDLCDITVGCNVNMVNSTDAAHGNVLKAGSRFIHNFGTSNTFVGINAGNFTTTGVGGNTAIGTNALIANTTGETCTAVGSNALAAHTTGTSNVAIGTNALNATTTSDFNIGLGSNTLLFNTTGTRNVALGDSALRNNIIGNNNIAVGKNALFINTGSNNVAIGDNAGLAITAGSNNISLGANAGGTLATGSGNIHINANALLAAEANTTRIGTAQTRCFIAGINGTTTGGAAISVLVDANGQLGTISSSEDVKHDIQDMATTSEAIYQLHPVTFVYNEDPTETTQYGLIAEEVDQVLPGIVVRNRSGKPETVQYHVLPVLLLNELQKLAARVAALEARG